MKQSLLFLLLLLSYPFPASALRLSDGKETLPITIHPEAEETVQFAAEDLARIIGAMTGATPTIEKSTEPKGIIIGTTAQFGVFQQDKGLAMHGPFDGREAYIIRPDEEKKQLWILGNREAGASHGVYSLLRENGYRAIFPGANWEVIPKLNTLSVEAPSEGRPKVLTRLIWAGFGSFDKEQSADVDKWRRRNRLGASMTGQIGHSWESMIRRDKAAFEANPDLFGLKKDGSLNRASLRHGSQAVVDYTVSFLKKRLEEQNVADVLSIAPTDGDNYSYDEETRGRGPVNESFYWYVNEVAKQAATFAPEHLIGTTAYYQHAKPPSFNLEPNVLVLGATMFGSGGLTLDEFFQQWSKRSRYIGIRDYLYSSYQHFGDHPNGGFSIKMLEQRGKWLNDYPITYYSAEWLWEWGLRGFAAYTIAQQLWDPSQDPNALLADAYQSAFGPGGDAMAQYYKIMEPKARSVRKHQIARGIKAVQEAVEKAAGDPDATARLNDIRLFLVHSALADQARALKPNDPERHRIVSDLLYWNYRNRRSYILNYNCNRRLWMSNAQFLGGYLERKPATFQKTAFSIKGEEAPTTAEEQDAIFQKVVGERWALNGGLIRLAPEMEEPAPSTTAEIANAFETIVVPTYPEIDVEEATYSTDYIPVDLGHELVLEENATQNYGAATQWLVWRPNGDTLNLQIQGGIRYPEIRPNSVTTITVESPEGEVAEPIKIPQAKAFGPVAIPIPQGGISRVSLSSHRRGLFLQGSQWEYIGIPTDESTTLFLNPPHVKSGLTGQPLYFYVPKGVQTIQIFQNLPGRFLKGATLAPWGGEPVEGTLEGELLSYPVPSGADGKVWEIKNGVGVRFYFLNLPNILNFHPGKLLLPSELVEKDGLKAVEP